MTAKPQPLPHILPPTNDLAECFTYALFDLRDSQGRRIPISMDWAQRQGLNLAEQMYVRNPEWRKTPDVGSVGC